ncbi:MAG: guanylate kinase [Burkholderiales bacterium]|nr:guanylate kinase [Burkholderiales bacterium]
MSGNVFIVSAPSGAGQTSLVKALLEADQQVKLSVSYTTRAPRPGEVDGEHYHFVSMDNFMAILNSGDFLESAEVYGNRYGTSQGWIEAQLASGVDILLEIDWQGAAQVRKLMPQAISIFVLPPSPAALRERLTGRGQDSEQIIAGRLAAAREDMSHVSEFDYVIINDDFATAAVDLQAVVKASRLTLSKQMAKNGALIESLFT